VVFQVTELGVLREIGLKVCPALVESRSSMVAMVVDITFAMDTRISRLHDSGTTAVDIGRLLCPSV